jgi:hypothetical protein
MLVASIYQRLGNTDYSLLSYQAARKTAGAAQAKGDPAGNKLIIQSGFGEGAVYVEQARWAEGAQIYEQTAAAAQQAGDTAMSLEAFRMAAYCHEQMPQPDEAWRCGWLALAAGENIAEDQRGATTLPVVGEGLLRLTAYPSYSVMGHEIDGRMRALVGDDWRAAARNAAL